MYYPFPGSEEFCSILANDPTIPRTLLMVLEDNTAQNDNSKIVLQRFVHKVSHFNNDYYLYTIQCDARHFGDRMGIHEVHVSTKMEDLQRAFGVPTLCVTSK